MWPGNGLCFLAGILVLFGLYSTSLYSYLLFHSLVEMFSIVVACGIFMVAWNARRLIDNNYLLFIGIAYLFVGGLELAHTLAYRGMGVFHDTDANLPTQLWIATRYTQSLSLFIAPWFLRRRLKSGSVFIGYSVFVALLLLSIFRWNIFPDCFVEGVGLTSFKKISEYIISLIFLGSAVLLVRSRREFDPKVLQWLVLSILLTIVAELAFTFYVSVYGLLQSGWTLFHADIVLPYLQSRYRDGSCETVYSPFPKLEAERTDASSGERGVGNKG